MDFSWTPEQLELRDAVIAFAKRDLGDDLIARDRGSVFSRDLWKRCAEFGIQGLPFPAEFCGGGHDVLTTVLVLEALGYSCRDNGLIFGLNAQMWSVQMPLLLYGTPEQKRAYLAPLCSGDKIGAHGMSEPGSGSDAFSLRTIAERRGDRYILNGSKTFVSEAPVADVFLVFATVAPSAGVLGITGFLIDRTAPGLRVGKPIEKMGLKTSPMSELMLDDCEVPLENRLGREGRGGQIFNEAMEWERGFILASYLGTMERQIQECSRHAKDRHQFGKPLAANQAVSNRLVQMRVRVDAARLLLHRAAWLKQHRRPAAAETAVAKLFLSEALVQNSLDAVQLFGGYGFTTEYQLERDLRDAVGSRLYSGTSEIQHELIARAMGL